LAFLPIDTTTTTGKEAAMLKGMSDDELKRRIDDLQDSGMMLAAKTLLRELNFRHKTA
jgi:hypothetical protein